jgi:hypothetical protein
MEVLALSLDDVGKPLKEIDELLIVDRHRRLG